LSKGIDFQTLSKVLDHDISEVRDDVRDQLGPKSGTKSLEKMLELADFLQEEKSREALMAFLEMGNQTINYNANVKPLIVAGIIELTIPESPRSRNQMYRLTPKGKQLLK